jgi:hypothetical protein
MMLTQISLPVCAVNDEGHGRTTGCRPGKPVTSSSDVKTSSTHLSNRTAVIQTSKHVGERDTQVVLAILHQRAGRHAVATAVSNLWIVNESLRFGDGQKWPGRVHEWPNTRTEWRGAEDIGMQTERDIRPPVQVAGSAPILSAIHVSG